MGGPLQKRDRRTRNVTLIRVLTLVRLLREPHTIPVLAEHLGVCTRTVRRDLELLEVVKVPLVKWPDKTWQVDRERW
jgi:predicted DNA-binding transcriptional regulator YafY